MIVTVKKDRFCFSYTGSELLADLTREKAQTDELAKLMVSGVFKQIQRFIWKFCLV